MVPTQSTSIVCPSLAESNLELVAVDRLTFREIGMNDCAGGKGRKEGKRDVIGALHVDADDLELSSVT